MSDHSDGADASTVIDSRPPTMKDVAERAGVSRPLVSMVLRGVAGPSEKSRERVLTAAAELGFRANTSARLLRQSRTGLIGVMFIASNSFESRFIERFLERAEQEGFGVVLSPNTVDRTTDVIVTELLGHRVEALACFNPEPDSTALNHALDTMPVVWLGERSSDPRADVVRTDDDAGLRLAVDHLVSLGHREITYVGGLAGTVGPDRARAYRVAMDAAGLADHVDIEESSFDEEEAASAARRILARENLPTAVIAASDQSALAVKAVFAAAGIAIPNDVSLIGYDDSVVAGFSFNALTTIRQDVDLTVEATLAAITGRLADPSTPTRDLPTPATLVIRATTGPARSAPPGD